ncbi:site-specific integrase [Tardiphaga sp. 215_C5_N2_1]|uniref:site-specific integrase n=1 Tax=Tardiphaga sp. 215_C5_N2_1 TaxID=3240774 RepID=UPI003F8967CE
MDRSLNNRAHAEALTLPVSARSRDNVQFSPQADQWVLWSMVYQPRTLRFDRFTNLGPRMKHCVKFGMLRVAERSSFGYTVNMFSHFLNLYLSQLHGKAAICSEVSLEDVLNYRATLCEQTEWKLGYVRRMFVDLHEMGLSITSHQAKEYLDDARLRRNVSGTEIRTRDPHTGAFDDVELLHIQSSLNENYERGKITLYQYAVGWLLIAYGSRPCQIAALKASDLIVVTSDDGKNYALRIPRAKQMGEEIRESFKVRHCSKAIGQLLEEVIEHNNMVYSGLDLERESWPLFFASRRERDSVDHHTSVERISYIMDSVVGRISRLKTNSRRFRSTIGQRAVDDGKDKYTVAELLDHSNVQSVAPYFEAGPKIVVRLDRALAMEMAPVAQAFSGTLVNGENEARGGDNRSSRIYDRTLQDNVALGTCGQSGPCELSVPYACYTCRRFQPWVDGPHEEFMNSLIADRQRMVEEDYSPRIFAIRDRTILAAAQVVQYCIVARGILEEPQE